MDQIPVEPGDLTQKPKKIVRAYVLMHLEKTDPLLDFDVCVVWFSKTLENWKALVTTTLPDRMYYEVTYNGAKQETYVDAYLKVHNFCVADSNLEHYTGPGQKSDGNDRFA